MGREGDRKVRGVRGEHVRLLVLVGLVAGAGACSSSPPSRLERSSAGVFGDFTEDFNGTPGGQYDFQVFIVDMQVGCTVAATAKVTINGVSYPIPPDCAIRHVPPADDGVITIRAEDGGASAEMVVSGLFPGMGATFAAPADGKATPGSDVVVAVPAPLQNRVAESLDVVVLVGPQDGNQFVTLNQMVGSEAHFTAPSAAGLYLVDIALASMLDVPAPITNCTGFMGCSSSGAAHLGPLSLEVVAP